MCADCGRAPSPRSSRIAGRSLDACDVRAKLSAMAVEFLVRAGVAMHPLTADACLLNMVHSADERTRLEKLHAEMQANVPKPAPAAAGAAPAKK